jgi:hypothetical protein
VTKAPGFFGYGGGIYNCPGSTLTIIHSTLRDNRARQAAPFATVATL